MNSLVFKKIDELNSAYIKVWEDVCNIESPTNYKEGVDKVGNYFANLAKERGWKLEVLKQDKAGDVVCVTMNADSNLAPVTLSGHSDTVHPVGLFGTPAVRIDENNIYGPGVNDCKGGIVAAFLAMDALRECGFTNRPVRMIIQTDEEVGSKISSKQTINYICEKSKDSAVFLNLEPFVEGKTVLKRKGVASYKFDITGVEGHSSRCAVLGANAVVDAAYKIIELDKIKDDAGTTCNCALINGGSVLNTIPGKCSFSVNFRYVNNKDLEWIDNYVHELANTAHVPGCTCTVELLTERPAMELTEKNLETLEKINKIFVKNGLETLEAGQSQGGSDGAYVTKAGIPCLDSLGTSGAFIHSEKEYAKLDSLASAAKRIAAVCMDI